MMRPRAIASGMSVVSPVNASAGRVVAEVEGGGGAVAVANDGVDDPTVCDPLTATVSVGVTVIDDRKAGGRQGSWPGGAGGAEDSQGPEDEYYADDRLGLSRSGRVSTNFS
jgi:hypothetical protein